VDRDRGRADEGVGKPQPSSGANPRRLRGNLDGERFETKEEIPDESLHAIDRGLAATHGTHRRFGVGRDRQDKFVTTVNRESLARCLVV